MPQARPTVARSTRSSLTRSLLRLVVLAVTTLSTCPVIASDPFQDLVNQVPRSANAIAVLNMEKAANSPMGLREGWKDKIEKAFHAGLVHVPPQATRFVLASQIDFEFMAPMWEAAVFDLSQTISMQQIAAARRVAVEQVEGLPAVRLPNDTYLVQLGPKRLAAMGPANRQMVVRWVREIRSASAGPSSPYLRKAAVYSDEAGTDIVMAVDLEGAVSPQRLAENLKSKQKLLKEWNADAGALANLLGGVQGVRVGVRIGEQPSARIAVDTSADASFASSYAKPLLLAILADNGASCEDVQSWNGKAEGNEIWLGGTLTNDGLRRLLSLVDSPTSEDLAKKPTPDTTSPGDLAEIAKDASLKHFHAVEDLFKDLQRSLSRANDMSASAGYYDRYARRIQKLPILDVDPELLNYSAFVASSMNKAAGAIRTRGIRGGVAESQVNVNSVGGYRYGANGYYGYDVYGNVNSFVPAYDPTGAAGEVESQRRVIRAEEKGEMASNVYAIRDEVVKATMDIRRKMTEKYRVEF